MISREAIKKLNMILLARRSNEEYVPNKTLRENEELVSFIVRLRDFGADFIDNIDHAGSIDTRNYLEEMLWFVESELGEASILASDIRATISSFETDTSMKTQTSSHCFYDDFLYLLAIFDCHV